MGDCLVWGLNNTSFSDIFTSARNVKVSILDVPWNVVDLKAKCQPS